MNDFVMGSGELNSFQAKIVESAVGGKLFSSPMLHEWEKAVAFKMCSPH